MKARFVEDDIITRNDLETEKETYKFDKDFKDFRKAIIEIVDIFYKRTKKRIKIE